MRLALLVALLQANPQGAGPQAPDRVRELLPKLESTDLKQVARAVEDLVALGAEALPTIEAASRPARDRSRAWLELAADEIRAARDLKAAYPTLRRVTVTSTERNAADLLTTLRTQTGLELNLDEILEEEGLPNIPVEVKDAAPLEALDAICRAGDISVTFEEGTLTLYTGGYEAGPKFFVGHYMVRLDRRSRIRVVDFENPSKERLMLEGAMAWNPALRVALARSDATVLEALDDTGRSLVPPPPERKEAEATVRVGAHDESAPSFDWDMQLDAIELLPPSREARKISLLRGYVTLLFPKFRTLIAFDKPRADASKEAEGFTAVIKSVDSSGRRHCAARIELSSKTLKPDDLKRKPILVELYSGGHRVRGYTTIQSGAAGVTIQADGYDRNRIVFQGGEMPKPPPLDRIEVTVVHETQERRIPFEFRDMKLK